MRRITDLTPSQIEAIRQQWIAGGKAAKIAPLFGITPNQLSVYASRHQWKQDRAKVSKALAENTPHQVAVRLMATAEDYVQQHTDDWQDLRRVASELVQTISSLPSVKDQASLLHAVTGALKYIQDGQRVSLGLNKQTPSAGADDHATALGEIQGRADGLTAD